MPYLLLADLALLVHFGFVLLAAGGGLLVLRWPRFALIQLPAALWGAVVEFGNYGCPLTDLENLWRRAGGGTGYTTTCLDRYLTPLLYPVGLERPEQLGLGWLVLLFNLGCYGLLLYRRRAGAGH